MKDHKWDVYNEPIHVLIPCNKKSHASLYIMHYFLTSVILFYSKYAIICMDILSSHHLHLLIYTNFFGYKDDQTHPPISCLVTLNKVTFPCLYLVWKILENFACFFSFANILGTVWKYWILRGNWVMLDSCKMKINYGRLKFVLCNWFVKWDHFTKKKKFISYFIYKNGEKNSKCVYVKAF